MVCSFIDHKNDVKMFKICSENTWLRLVVPLEFAHFDMISMFEKSTDHGKMLNLLLLFSVSKL